MISRKETFITMLLLSCVSVSITLLGQPAATSKDAFATSDARLDLMQKAVATNDIRALDDRATTIRLQAEPMLRFTNPVGGSKDGAEKLASIEFDNAIHPARGHS
jgi:hypothetical protein